MSDIYVPGVRSRFNTEKVIEDLMQVERIPRDRVEKNVENLQAEKGYWQEVGRRMSSLRESARLLYSFQNPFNDRITVSQNESVITGTATREAVEQERSFTVKQTAAADRLLSVPLEESRRIEGGVYTFSVGKDEISFNFRGGSLKDFTEALNRRGRDKIRGSLVTVQPGTKSLLIESLVTGADKRLGFSGNAEKLAIETGIVERASDAHRDITLNADSVRMPGTPGQTRGLSPADPTFVSLTEDTLRAAAGGRALIVLDSAIRSQNNLVLGFEASTEITPEEDIPIPSPPPGPSIPGSGSVTYGEITIENDISQAPIPPWTPPEAPQRVDDLGVLSVTFSDGTSQVLPPIGDSESFTPYQYRLSDIAGDKLIVSMELNNRSTHRDVSVKNIRVFDPSATGDLRPRNPISLAQDAVLSMDGIEVTRPTNTIGDLIPGVTVTVHGPSERPVKIEVQPDRESVKDSIISLVGNYNRLMAEVNILTRNDDRLIQELSYLSPEEQEEFRMRLGIFAGDSTLNQFKNSLQRAAAVPYPVQADEDLRMLAQIGIGSDVRGAGSSTGYDASRLRGYLEIDEKALDAAIASRLPAVQQLFGVDTDGDLIIDSGLAYALDTLSRPYVETGGIISLKTSTLDSRISQEQRRIDTLDRQLANKERTLKNQYGQMEEAYNRMERMSTSLDQFSQRANNNNR
jgi:flagellar hook-associated protein 2